MKKRSTFGKLVVLAIIGLAVFGGYTIYKNNETKISNVNAHVNQAWADLQK